MANYASITKSANPEFGSGGYKNEFLFAPLADFLSLKAPVISATPVLGEYKTIATAHTFTSPKGFISYAAKVHSATGKSATVGDDGAQEIEHTYEIEIIGDGPTMLEQMERLINEDTIILFQDAECGNSQYVQLGNACVVPTIKVDWDAKTTKDGKKVYKITAVCKKKYFYTATVTKAS